MSSRTARATTALVLVLALPLAGCAPSDGSAASQTATDGFFDTSRVHEIDLVLTDDALDEALDGYLTDGEKVWVHGDVTIDGTTFEDVGLRLKGNSTLREVTADTPAQDLPWLVRLDKWVEGQDLDGVTRLAVRSSTTQSSINELVAMTLLGEADLETSRVAATRVSANGGEASLHAVVEVMDEQWAQATFDGETILYKSDADGDWSNRGTDPTAYTEAFDVEAGEEDWQPVADLMVFLDEATDAELEAELDEHVDVEQLARYLALEDLMDNFDDIDGPGNNSYLAYDVATGVFTVVAWDHNLTFGVQNGGPGGGGGGAPEGMERPTDGERPEGFPTDMPTDLPEGFPTDMPTDLPEGAGRPGDRGAGGDAAGGGPGGGFGGASNPLAERFHSVASFEALYDQATEDLRADLFTSGTLEDVVDAWSTTLAEGAADLVDADALADEAAQVAAYGDGTGADG